MNQKLRAPGFLILGLFFWGRCTMNICKRSQVPGSTFRVRDKDKIEDPKSSQKMLVLPHICQCAANFQIGNDEAGPFSHKYASKMESGDKNVTLNL